MSFFTYYNNSNIKFILLILYLIEFVNCLPEQRNLGLFTYEAISQYILHRRAIETLTVASVLILFIVLYYEMCETDIFHSASTCSLAIMVINNYSIYS